MKLKEIKDNKLGCCPKCKSNDIEYGESCVQDEFIFYRFSCRNCEATGKEWYELTYMESVVEELEEGDKVA